MGYFVLHSENKHSDSVSSVPCKPLDSKSVKKKENFSNIFHPDDLLTLYQNKGLGLKVPAYNLDVKQKARSQNVERLKNIKDYCKKSLKTNYYLQMANEHIEDANKFLYFDFYYAFLYCQTQKVRESIIHFFKSLNRIVEKINCIEFYIK